MSKKYGSSYPFFTNSSSVIAKEVVWVGTFMSHNFLKIAFILLVVIIYFCLIGKEILILNLT